MRVAVTGASGLVGSALVPHWQAQGHTVLRLVRHAPRGPDEVPWDPARGVLNPDLLQGLDAAVHLAGENVGDGRWTDERRARILSSRVQGGQLLARALAGLARPPAVLISASAVGYYGDTGDRVIDDHR
jgi:NAD dependent epimerase/dehydratase family enzyme